MKETLRKFLDNLKYEYMLTFKPTVYIVIQDSFLGDYIEEMSHHRYQGVNVLGQLTYIDYSGDEPKQMYVDSNKYFIFKKNAQKEVAKSVIPVNTENMNLVNELINSGIKLKEYEKQQIIEDGEASEVYLRYRG